MLWLAVCLAVPWTLFAPCNECERRASERAAMDEEETRAGADGLPGESENSALKVARSFVAAMGSAQAEALGQLASDPFNFDGRVVSGREAIVRRFQELLPPQRDSLTGKQKIDIQVLDVAQATRRFGPLPKKFAGAFPPGAVFAAVTFEKRAGFVLVLVRQKSDWKVIAIAE